MASLHADGKLGDIPDGMADLDGRNCIGCNADGGMMFIERAEEDHLIWRCSRTGVSSQG
jgi:hypothetical protein